MCVCIRSSPSLPSPVSLWHASPVRLLAAVHEERQPQLRLRLHGRMLRWMEAICTYLAHPASAAAWIPFPSSLQPQALFPDKRG